MGPALKHGLRRDAVDHGRSDRHDFRSRCRSSKNARLEILKQSRHLHGHRQNVVLRGDILHQCQLVDCRLAVASRNDFVVIVTSLPKLQALLSSMPIIRMALRAERNRVFENALPPILLGHEMMNIVAHSLPAVAATKRRQPPRVVLYVLGEIRALRLNNRHRRRSMAGDSTAAKMHSLFDPACQRHAPCDDMRQREPLRRVARTPRCPIRKSARESAIRD